MALVLFPGQLNDRADLYHQLATALSAGLPLTRAIDSLAERPPAFAFRRPLRRALARLSAGDTFTEALRSLGRWVPEFDLALIEAGEKSGRLDECLRLLARFCLERAKIARTVIGGLIYPALLFHVAFLILPIQRLIALVMQADVAGFLLQKLLFFAPIYLVVLFLVFAGQGSHGRFWRLLVERICGLVPILRRARRGLVLGRLATALNALLNAGVPTPRAWPLAAAASGSPTVEREVAGWEPYLEAGETPGDLVGRSSVFPNHFASIYRTGELSGQIGTVLPRLAEHYLDEGARKMKQSALTLTGLVYLAVMLVAAYYIVTFWTGYYNSILDAF